MSCIEGWKTFTEVHKMLHYLLIYYKTCFGWSLRIHANKMNRKSQPVIPEYKSHPVIPEYVNFILHIIIKFSYFKRRDIPGGVKEGWGEVLMRQTGGFVTFFPRFSLYSCFLVVEGFHEGAAYIHCKNSFGINSNYLSL